MRWLRRWHERDDRHLFKAAAHSSDIDPIEELARILGEAQERDAEDERRFEDSALGGGASSRRPEGQVGPSRARI
jgi:hypothetical protein